MQGLEQEVLSAIQEIKICQLKEIRKSLFNSKYAVQNQRTLIRVTTLENELLTILATKQGYKVISGIYRCTLTIYKIIGKEDDNWNIEEVAVDAKDYYETLPSLLMATSNGFKEEFQRELYPLESTNYKVQDP
jgi:hypothetical protein